MSPPLPLPHSARSPDGPGPQLDLSIVVPTFEERDNIAELLRRLRRALTGLNWELTIVDDDSPDGTAHIVRELARSDPKIRCLQRIGRRGLASACVEGMLASSADAILTMDADLQHDESRIPLMLAELRRGEADIVVASRYSPGGTVQLDAGRIQWSRWATRLSRMVCRQPICDPMSGFFLIRRSVLDLTVHRLSVVGFKILLDIIASAPRPLRIKELPFDFRSRIAGRSKLDSLVAWEFGMLLADKMVGRYIPTRFVAFAIVGIAGVAVHLMALATMLHLLRVPFAASQGSATLVAMLFNFALNNILTYRDRRLHGWRWWRGLVSFVLACALGAVANVGVASYLFQTGSGWIVAGLGGVCISAVWNFAVTRSLTWGSARDRI
jgi:dolichol-phosphate mannosyltransferase